MARGGPRPGSGRKPGTVSEQTRRRREAAEKAAAEGITPLEVMLQTMRDAWDNGDREKACTVAKDAAPYVHPKLSAVEAKVDADLRARVINAEPLTEDEWIAQYGSGVATAAGAAESAG